MLDHKNLSTKYLDLQQEQNFQLSSNPTSEAIVHKFLDISNIDNMTNRVTTDDMSYAGVAIGLPDNFLNNTDVRDTYFYSSSVLYSKNNNNRPRFLYLVAKILAKFIYDLI